MLFLVLYLHVHNLCTQKMKLKHHPLFSLKSLKKECGGDIDKRCVFHKIHCFFYLFFCFFRWTRFSNLLREILARSLVKLWLPSSSVESSWFLLNRMQRLLTWNQRFRAMKFPIKNIFFCSKACSISGALVCYSSKSAEWISVLLRKSILSPFTIIYPSGTVGFM